MTVRRAYIRQPFAFGAEKTAASGGAVLRNGVTLTADADRHLRDKILAVLFTAPGERVNEPRFGVGLNRMVFEGLNEITITALEYRVSEGLRRDIGDEMVLEELEISSDPPSGELLLSIRYSRREDRTPQSLEIQL